MKMKLNLNGKGDSKSRRVKPWQIIVGVIALVMVPAVGNTFAGSITVNANGGNKVEFGQGITGAVACDNDVLITPSARYDSSTAAFYLESITVSNVDFNSTASDSCLGKTFKLAIIDSVGATSQWGSGNNSVSFLINSTNAGTAPTNQVPSSNFSMVTGGNGTDSGTAYFAWTGTITSSLRADKVDKVIIQTQ
jgi:hypothetical protein